MQNKKTVFLTRVAMLSAIAVTLMQLDFPLPIFPFFLKMDISDIPALIGTLMLGPVAGIVIELIKNVLNFIFATTTWGVGEAANFIIGTAFLLPMWYCYKDKKTNKSLLVGFVFGSLSMIIVASVFNYYILIPTFLIIFGIPIEEIVKASAAFNKHVVDFPTLIIYTIAPFNLLKCLVMSITTFLVQIPLKRYFAK